VRPYQCANCLHLQEPVDGKCPFCGTEGPPQHVNAHMRAAHDELDDEQRPRRGIYWNESTSREEHLDPQDL
jgi:hypothetical protein